MAATTPPDEPADHSDDASSIEITPSLNLQTRWDRQAVLVEVEDSNEKLLETAIKSLARAIREINGSKINICHTEYIAWNIDTSVVFALSAYSGKIQDSSQSTFTDLSGDAVEVEPVLKLALDKVTGCLPDSLEATIGPIPFGMFGRGPSVTTRLVMDGHNQKITHANKVSETGLKELLSEYKDEQWLYCSHTRRNTGAPEKFEYQITARIALFDPRYRITSEKDYVSTLRFGRQKDPAEVFADLGVTSSLSLIDDQYSLISLGSGTDVIPRTDSPLGHPTGELRIINGDDQYDEILRGGYGASDKFESLCSYTSILAREADLHKFHPLAAAPVSGDPSAHLPQVTPLGVDKLGTDLSEINPEPVLISADPAVDPDREIRSQTSSTANDGTQLHWQAIEDTAMALKSKGYKVHIVRQDTGSRPDLWVQHPNGEIYAVEVESTTRSKPASFLTNLARQALWGYKTITVVVPQQNKEGRWESLQTIGDWAVDKSAKPFITKDLSRHDSRTAVHTLSEDIVVDGKTIVLPEDVSQSEWSIMPPDRYVLVDGRTIIAEGKATDPIEEFEFHTPRYYEEDGMIIVEDADGNRLQTVPEVDDVAYTRASPPSQLVDLSYIEYVEAIYCYDPDNRELVQHEITADWDTSRASNRHEKSHEDAFGTFVLEQEDTRLMEEDCRPFIRDWISNLSAHGPPAPNVYGKYRKQYYGKSSSNADVGKIHHYPEATLRFGRGNVPPDIQGLSTKPSFPADWDVDPEDVLREPLIYGLDDIRDVGANGRTRDN